MKYQRRFFMAVGEYIKFFSNPKRVIGFIKRVFTLTHDYTVMWLQTKLYGMLSFIEDPRLYKLHKDIQQVLKEQKKAYPLAYIKGKYSYQAFAELHIAGYRPTEKRFYEYKLMDYLSTDKTVLDVGANSCFLSTFVARYSKHVDAIEINPYAVRMGQLAAEYLNLKNTNFMAGTFEDFKTDKKYDIILACASYNTSDRQTIFNLEQYNKKCYDLLKDDGLLLFESHGFDWVDKEKYKIFKEAFVDQWEILEEREVVFKCPTERNDNLMERTFLVCKKK